MSSAAINPDDFARTSDRIMREIAALKDARKAQIIAWHDGESDWDCDECEGLGEFVNDDGRFIQCFECRGDSWLTRCHCSEGFHPGDKGRCPEESE